MFEMGSFWCVVWRRVALVGLVVGSMAFLPGCGGGSSGGSGGGPTQPSAPVRTVLLQDTWTAGFLEFVLFEGQVSTSGTLDVTVDWTFATNDVDIIVTDQSCSQAAFPFCTFLASAESVGVKPETVTLSVTSGTYRIWVFNFGPTNESGSIQAGLTS